MGILTTGEATAYTCSRYGTYADLFRGLLSEPDVEWQNFDSQKGERPEKVTDYDGFVITGSAETAHEPHPWILSLNALIREIVERDVRLLGVCFGHQAVANALGGRSGINPAGWEMGLYEVIPTDALKGRRFARGVDSSLCVLESHRDHVAELPPGSELLAYSERTPVQMFALGDRVLCMQGHPEFNNDIVRDLAESRGETGTIPADIAHGALQSLRRQPHRDQWTTLLKRFLYESEGA